MGFYLNKEPYIFTEFSVVNRCGFEAVF